MTHQVQVRGDGDQRYGALAISAEAIIAEVIKAVVSDVELSCAGGDAISACVSMDGCRVEVPVIKQLMTGKWQTLREQCGARNSTAGFATWWNITRFGSRCKLR